MTGLVPHAVVPASAFGQVGGPPELEVEELELPELELLAPPLELLVLRPPELEEVEPELEPELVEVDPPELELEVGFEPDEEELPPLSFSDPAPASSVFPPMVPQAVPRARETTAPSYSTRRSMQ
jgi:hypothetical protein